MMHRPRQPVRDVTGLLLAAGESSRFGSQKLLHSIGSEPLIRRSAASLSRCDRIIAVIRQQDEALSQVLQSAGITMVINPQAGQGMGSSLACGVRASVDSDAWCILPADMPYLDASTTSRIVNALRNDATIAAPFYQGRRGHPVGFSRAYKEHLLALNRDHGARELLLSEAAAMLRIEVDDPGILIDIDTPEDLMTSSAALPRE